MGKYIRPECFQNVVFPMASMRTEIDFADIDGGCKLDGTGKMLKPLNQAWRRLSFDDVTQCICIEKIHQMSTPRSAACFLLW